MTINRARYRKIERLTETLLDEGKISGPPVNIVLLMRKHGILISSGDLGAVSGLIVRRKSNTTVGVNNKQAPVRQRFTLAHEYGHFLLHEGLITHADEGFIIRYRDDKSPLACDVEEIEANFFAACLLMPKLFLDNLNAESCLDDDVAVKRLAKIFCVSQHAMSLRLVNIYKRCVPF